VSVDPSIELVIAPRTRDLGDGFQVRRSLPDPRRGMVGPFIFFDQMGPTTLQASKGLDVRPHPHIGLATITYLFEGEILHRDNLGVVQPIRPGEVNWMTAGQGIAHSERTPDELRKTGGPVFGIQLWVALPKTHEEVAPSFVHYAANEMPFIEDHKLRVHLIAGSLFGAKSPVRTLSELFYADAQMDSGASLLLPPTHEERAAYVAIGQVEVDGVKHDAGQLLVFAKGQDATIAASQDSRVLLLGGDPMESPRYIWWNFVSSSKDRIEQAKADWRAKRFPAVPNEHEFIPLPEGAPGPVMYP
jgi:redox-sensitive bicupin YhaK (pirin superfamily)